MTYTCAECRGEMEQFQFFEGETGQVCIGCALDEGFGDTTKPTQELAEYLAWNAKAIGGLIFEAQQKNNTRDL